MTLYFGNTNPINDLADAIRLYGPSEFASPTRSTIPMLSLMRNPDVFRSIVEQLGMPTDYDQHLEYTVKSPLGKGPASHTDLMLKSGEHALAIEAKWTEPMYPTVKDWKKSTTEGNNTLVLQGWLQLLQPAARKALTGSHFDLIVNQMLHRAASAAASGSLPSLAYFLFKPSPSSTTASAVDLLRELGSLWNALGAPSGFPFSVVEIETQPTETYDQIANLPKGKAVTSNTIVAALLNEAPLFEFPCFNITPVDGNQ